MNDYMKNFECKHLRIGIFSKINFEVIYEIKEYLHFHTHIIL